jgi:hypothetical protein
MAQTLLWPGQALIRNQQTTSVLNFVVIIAYCLRSAFEARHRIIAERSKLSGNLCGKGKSSGEWLLSLYYLLRKDGRPLAFFNDKCMYSPLGMFIWMDFWAAGANFGPLSKILHASNRAVVAELAEEDFMM